VGKSRAARRVRAIREPEASVPCEANAGGIAQCLKMLAEEAASVGFTGTVAALRTAIAVCERELAQEDAPRDARGGAAQEEIPEGDIIPGDTSGDAQPNAPAPRPFAPVTPILPAVPTVN